MDATDFLTHSAPGYEQLSQPERKAISDFTLLWSAMEWQMLETNAKPESLVKASERLAENGWLKAERFQESFAYFQDRYFQGGKFTNHFEQLQFRKNDSRPLVEAVLSGNDTDVQHVVAALLLIVYRLRNNLFHGIKWAYGIEGQLGNFTHANRVLMEVLRRNQAL